MFYLLVAGSRSFTDYQFLSASLDKLLVNQSEVTVVSGGARGADTLAERYAHERGYQVRIFPADWNRFGKSAGYRRNRQMHEFIAQFSDRGCVCFWDGNSRGTAHNFDLANEFHTPLRIIRFNKEESKGSSNHFFVLHQTNCQNAFGSGFASYLNRVFPTAKARYHQFIRQMREAGFTHDTDLLGQAVEAIGDNFTVVHCFGQRFYGNSRRTGRCYTNYDAVEQSLKAFRKRHPDDIAICPQYMGCGLAGGNWTRYSELLDRYHIIPCDDIDLVNHTFHQASK